MKNLDKVSHFIIDWGTTNFRAFAMDVENHVIEVKESPLGLLQVCAGKFAETLENVLIPWIPEYAELPIYMAGMVGSAKGWFNVPYVETPVTQVDLAKQSYKFTLPWGAKATIIPGASFEYQQDMFDVMRGEEVQLFGLAKLIGKTNFTAILPGTHSKHVQVGDKKLTSFSSHLTGEFYDILLKHSLLGKGLSKSDKFDEKAFLKGVNEGQQGQLTQRIFLAWTHRLFNQLTEVQIPDYLSGFLIGYELKNINTDALIFVGGKLLCERYQIAAKHMNITTEYYAGNDCFLAGMNELIKDMSHE